MTSRGCVAVGQNIYLFQKNGTYEYVPAQGAAGGAGYNVGWGLNGLSPVAGRAGGNGWGRRSGGGGSGSGRNWMQTVNVGRGGYGTSYSGGAGSGSAQCDGGWGGTHNSDNAPDNGGAGGNPNAGAGNYSGYGVVALGGQGNPYCSWASCAQAWANTIRANKYGTGGLLIVYAGILENNGTIESQGGDMLTCNSGSNKGHYVTTGGASGGGSVNIFYSILEKRGSIIATGGRFTGGGSVNMAGGNGGDGCVTLYENRILFLNLYSRKNSNFYKLIQPQEVFDWNTLFD